MNWLIVISESEYQNENDNERNVWRVKGKEGRKSRWEWER